LLFSAFFFLAFQDISSILLQGSSHLRRRRRVFVLPRGKSNARAKKSRVLILGTRKCKFSGKFIMFTVWEVQILIGYLSFGKP